LAVNNRFVILTGPKDREVERNKSVYFDLRLVHQTRGMIVLKIIRSEGEILQIFDRKHQRSLKCKSSIRAVRKRMLRVIRPQAAKDPRIFDRTHHGSYTS
jgi:hypothetical protein